MGTEETTATRTQITSLVPLSLGQSARFLFACSQLFEDAGHDVAHGGFTAQVLAAISFA